MIVNGETLRTLNITYSALFQNGFKTVADDWNKIAMKAPSSTLASEYGWLGMFPQVREWIGDRTIQGMTAHGYRIVNRDFELTISVKRNDIEDDNIGIYAAMMQEFGRSVGDHPNQLVMGLLAAGFSTTCYDGQYFFDVDHPVIDANGNNISVANTDLVAGNGPAWYLLDTSRAMRPLIFQERRPFNFVAKDKPNDDNVFFKKEYVYGTDGRCNVGYGFWQLA